MIPVDARRSASQLAEAVDDRWNPLASVEQQGVECAEPHHLSNERRRPRLQISLFKEPLPPRSRRTRLWRADANRVFAYGQMFVIQVSADSGTGAESGSGCSTKSERSRGREDTSIAQHAATMNRPRLFCDSNRHTSPFCARPSAPSSALRNSLSSASQVNRVAFRLWRIVVLTIEHRGVSRRHADATLGRCWASSRPPFSRTGLHMSST